MSAQVIWKARIEISSEPTDVTMPVAAALVHAKATAGHIDAWFLFQDHEPMAAPRQFAVYGTGHQAPAHDQAIYQATVPDSPFVWHVYELIS